MNLTIFPLVIAGWQWVAIVLVVLLLFGGKKIPELMKGLGKGVKGFKDGVNGIEEEINKPVEPKKDTTAGTEKK